MALLWVDYTDKTANIDQWGTSAFWLADIPYAAAPVESHSGPITDNSPVDVVTDVLSGIAPYDLLTPWRRCMILLTRI